MLLGLVGIGTVGSTLKTWLEENTNHKPRLYDPHKGYIDDIANCNLLFVAVNIENKSFEQNIEAIEETIQKAKQDAIIVIRSTVVPGTCDRLAEKHKKLVCQMPEFLTERRAQKDFNEHDVYIGYPKTATVNDEIKISEYIHHVFYGKKRVHMRKNVECELGKYGHNCFGAMKVTYFNIIKDLCDKEGADFESVKDLMFSTGFISKEHTKVPGPDGKLGYSGKCFPPNIESMLGYTKDHASVALFKDIFCLNKLYRPED